MITKNTFLIVFVFFLNHLGIAQEDPPSATFLSNSTNKAHPFYGIFIKKDVKYMSWLYFHCKGLSDTNSLKTPMNSSLIFSIKQEDAIGIDTISNCVYPKLYEDEREQEWQSETPLYGSFPSYINFHLKNDPQTTATIELSIHRESSAIHMYVLTEEGDLVSTITDKTLTQGSHTLSWDTHDIKSGTYLLFTEIDSQVTIHSIAVEKNWLANIFSRNKEVWRPRKTIKFSFESSDVPTPEEREFHYVLKNRFGTSFGVNLLAESKVKIKLYTIKGDYISTINDGKLSAGASEFLLDTHIEKASWYLVKLTINDKITHSKLNIKK
ncbi:MAG: hypothetical protein ACI9Y7_002593 [Dokdonia sp.]|jgi:hypothetical protein